MNERDFVYWLNGFIELHGSAPTEQQWQQIKDHLNLVFDKVTPDYNDYPIQPLAHDYHLIKMADTSASDPSVFRAFEQFGQKLCSLDPSSENPNAQYPISC